MRIVVPVEIKEPMLVSTNVPENDTADWNSATTYGRGGTAMSFATHTVYRSLRDSNLNVNPDLEQVALADPLIADPDPVSWQVISRSNRWRAFDEKPSQLATNPEVMTYEMKPGRHINEVALFRVDASRVVITVDDPTVGRVMTEERQLANTNMPYNFFDYYFLEIVPLTEVSIGEIPPYDEATITVTLYNPGGNVSVGQLILGTSFDIGFIQAAGSGFSGLDFSYVHNDDFGNLSTVRRESTRISDFSIVVDSRTLFTLDARLRSLRGGKSVVWIGDEDPRMSALNYGFYRSYRVDYQDGPKSLVSIQVQGIV